MQTGSWGREDMWLGSSWRTQMDKAVAGRAAGRADGPTFVQINWEEQLESKRD